MQIEFARKLAVPVDCISDLRLYAFIKQWLGTPYLWGGDSPNGIDCSLFVRRLYRTVYNIEVPRTSITQFYAKEIDVFKDTRYLTEGDFVFFKTLHNGNQVTHVGLYLRNGYFVNSESKGVSIASLQNSYWSDRYVAAGRLKQSYFSQ